MKCWINIQVQNQIFFTLFSLVLVFKQNNLKWNKNDVKETFKNDTKTNLRLIPKVYVIDLKKVEEEYLKNIQSVACKRLLTH